MAEPSNGLAVYFNLAIDVLLVKVKKAGENESTRASIKSPVMISSTTGDITVSSA